jgi:PAS domain S-box-containing protein
MNEFQNGVADTPERTRGEKHIEGVRQQGGFFVEAVRVTRMPMVVTDALLPGNPILFANGAFKELSGYDIEELTGQDPHFMNGPGTDPESIVEYQTAIEERRDATLEILQYRKDGTPFHAMLFASPLKDGEGKITHHFLSYLDITRRHDAEAELRALTADLEARVAARTAELEAANARLTELDREREMLMVEVNHRAKNSLTIAASLLAMQRRRHTDPLVTVPLEETEDRIRAMARVHDLLSKSESAQRVNVATYIVDLCEALTTIMEHDGRIRLEARVEDGILVDADTAVPLGMVLTELVTNAVKYAFPAPRTGAITAHARRRHCGRVELVIEDDGVGASGFREGALGMGLVRSLVQQIKARSTSAASRG